MNLSQTHRLRRALGVALAALLAAWGVPAGSAPGDASPAAVDCTAKNPACPPLEIVGDPSQQLPNGEPSPFRGKADPSIRRDPLTGRLWMVYSWPHLAIAPGLFGRPSLTGVVDTHLAHSDDGGATWRADPPLWHAGLVPDPGRHSGEAYTSNEVPSIAPMETESGIVWVAARLVYLVKPGARLKGRRGDSFQLRIAAASSPTELARAPEAILGGAITAPGWKVDANLSSLSPALSDCTLWTEPALFADEGVLYLEAECRVYDLRTRKREPTRDRLVVFATRPRGNVHKWSWREVGVLAGHQEGVELGAENLTQCDLARGQDGALLAIVTPTDYDPKLDLDVHHGCRILAMASLDPPRLQRDAAGSLIVRASVTASDLRELGPGACGYDPASSTGVLLVRRRIQGKPPEFLVSIHRTGLRP